jgi:hypothetical protein
VQDAYPIISQAQLRVITFYDNSETYLQMKLYFSLLLFTQRLYVVLMLVNSNVKPNVFAWLYLLLAMYFFWWSRSSNTNSTQLNKFNWASVVIIISEYLLLLLNLNSVTSLVDLPSYLLTD